MPPPRLIPAPKTPASLVPEHSPPLQRAPFSQPTQTKATQCRNVPMSHGHTARHTAGPAPELHHQRASGRRLQPYATARATKKRTSSLSHAHAPRPHCYRRLSRAARRTGGHLITLSPRLARRRRRPPHCRQLRNRQRTPSRCWRRRRRRRRRRHTRRASSRSCSRRRHTRKANRCRRRRHRRHTWRASLRSRRRHT